MVELVQLESHAEEFAKRNTRIVAASLEGVEVARETQKANPHLIVLADKERGLTNALELLHKQSAPDGGDTDTPTTFLIDRHGVVRWMLRPDAVYTRISPDELLRIVGEKLPAK